ncbi:HD domain-containing protein [Halobacterium rubrum]|uniref:HD domain-containing protein n=1 Tax=Halobacterium TaxID=2239 RepID=UPI001F313225|nr:MULTISPECIES: HD family hydrolase [Halobacterium]MDH5020381.1 HD family hydrolase [Halobacterium rubrum]
MMGQLEFLLQAIDLKDLARKGWELRGVEAPEKVASHSWGVTLLTMRFVAETELDELRAMKMAVIHDLAEAEAGDRAIGEVYQEVSQEQKVTEEVEAWDNFEEIGDIGNWRELWEEFENETSTEAEFVADMDLLDMCLTALKYERQQRYDSSKNTDDYDHLDGFFATADKKIRTEIGREIYESIRTEYQEAKRQNSSDT